MSNDEKIRAMNVVHEAVEGRGIVVGGAGNNSTSESLEFVTRVNRETKVDAIMSVVPYYTKPPQAGIRAHFTEIANLSDRPVIIYNVPSRTVASMTAETVLHLFDHANIVACKEASGDIYLAGTILRDLDGRGTLLSGDDGSSAAFVAIGGHGVISVASNVAPRLMSDLVRAARESDRARLQELNKTAVILQDILFRLPSPIPVKAAVEHLGFGSASVRMPLVPMDEADRLALIATLDELGLRA